MVRVGRPEALQMVPLRSLQLASLALTVGGLSACSADVITPAGNHYEGHGFVVHEWGTDTIVVGSDGSLQRGLHHEEEDLPSFVYDRVKAGALPGSSSVEGEMETPVTYFYSGTPRSGNVTVG